MTPIRITVKLELAWGKLEMKRVPTYKNFVLAAAIDAVPAGATGQLKRLDIYHVSLEFDHYTALVFDVYDTDPEVWAAIKPANTATSSYRGLALALAVVLAVTPLAWATQGMRPLPACFYTVAIALCSLFLATRSALLVASFSAVLYNIFAVPPIGIPTVPTTREIVIYGCWAVLALMITQIESHGETVRRYLLMT